MDSKRPIIISDFDALVFMTEKALSHLFRLKVDNVGCKARSEAQLDVAYVGIRYIMSKPQVYLYDLPHCVKDVIENHVGDVQDWVKKF